MKITPKSRFITNGKVYVKLGFYWQDNSYNKRPPGNGDFSGCKHWPATYQGRLYSHSNGRIPLPWLRGRFRFLKGFIAIKRSLVPAHILKALEA